MASDAEVFLGVKDGAYLRHEGPAHVLLSAPTRSGKDVGVIIPTLLGWGGSVVVNDIKGENWARTAGYRAQFSRCYRFDPTKMLTHCYNPLLAIRQGINEVRDTQNVADILVDPEGSVEKLDYWERASRTLLVGCILHVLYAEEDKSLAGLTHFLSYPGRTFYDTLSLMARTQHLSTGVHPVIGGIAQEMLNKEARELSSVLSTAMSFLFLYRDPLVAHATRACHWLPEDLQVSGAPVSLYLVTPPSDLHRTKALFRMMLNQWLRRLTEDLEVEADLLLLLNEFPSLGHLDFFEQSLGYLAGYNIRSLLVTQSLKQLDYHYGRDHSILDNCHVQLFMGANDNETAHRISRMLGEATFERRQHSTSGGRFALWHSKGSVTNVEHARALLTESEVMQLDQNDLLIKLAGHPPLRAEKLRYYADPNFQERLQPPPVLTDLPLRATCWDTEGPKALLPVGVTP